MPHHSPLAAKIAVDIPRHVASEIVAIAPVNCVSAIGCSKELVNGSRWTTRIMVRHQHVGKDATLDDEVFTRHQPTVEETQYRKGCLIMMISILDDEPGTRKVGKKLICEGIGKLPCVSLKERYG